jgi:hypothetical protein
MGDIHFVFYSFIPFVFYLLFVFLRRLFFISFPCYHHSLPPSFPSLLQVKAASLSPLFRTFIYFLPSCYSVFYPVLLSHPIYMFALSPFLSFIHQWQRIWVVGIPPYPTNSRRQLGFPCILTIAEDSLGFPPYPNNDTIVRTIQLM